MITLIERRQFSGAKSESPLNHLREFEKYCNTIKVNGISQEFIRLKLFPFSLIGRALEWLDKEVKPNSLTTWDEVTKAFLSRFYPQKKTAEARALIQGFKQRPNENLYEAWERYKEYQRECPHHGIPIYQVIQIFYRGLSAQGKEVTSIKAKLESVSTNSLSFTSQSKGRGTFSNSSPSTSNNMPSGCLFCDSCGSYDHDSSMCSQTFVDGCDDVEINECEHVNFVSNVNGGQRFDGPKNFSNRNSHPQGGFDNYNNGGYRNQGNQGFRGNYNNQGYSNQNPSHGYGNQSKSQGFGNHYYNGGNNQGRGNWNNNQNRGSFQNNNQREPPPGLAPKPQGNGENSYSQTSSFKTNLEEMIDNQTKIINTYMADCASSSSLPSQGVEPKKLVCSITTRSGRVLNEGASRSIEEDEERSDPRMEIEKDESKSVSYEEVQEKKRSSEKEREEVRRPDLPYPQKFLRHKIDEQFGKFIAILKEAHLSIPFTDSITQMPSAFIHNELPKEMKDPGNFSIPCEIKRKMFNNAFCDLGASVSVMPYSIFKKLKLGELLPSNITLQLADRNIMIPKGRVEDVPLKIGGFTIPVDFIVLEIAEDDHIPIILGRPFLATSGALINVKGGRITLRIGKKEESFELKPMNESLSLVKGIMCANSPRSIDNVCMINSSTNDDLENCDDVLSSFDGKKVMKRK
ncbi:uncharacterized protein LOC110703498 [Chenopodium quinoa]|uniref:uncharacterized protein LOC110703498 n=1 Tax=Chenopodium quinoa TaxID=63459 RepID=UPI000B777F40|nr:uncharacterized protein LOC110703498 [Chenopodium quinoa]